MKILVADDSRSELKNIEAILMDAGHRCIIVEGSDNLLDILLDEGPRIAIFDWMMPGINGLELVKKLRADADLKHYVYTIIITGRNSQKTLIDAMEAGVDDFIVTPFEPDELIMRVGVAERFLKTYQRLMVLERESVISEMGASLKHSIFNPLTAILGAAELLLLNDSLGEGVRSKIEIICDNARRIEELVRKVEKLHKQKSVKVLEGLRMLDLDEC